MVHWLGRIKAAAARVNADLGLLDADLAARIAAAADEVAAGDHDDQFPIDVFQTGSGTSSNMNANEVIAALAGEGVHPNDHVNMGQSSNDVFPSAVHLAALDRIVHELPPALDLLAAALAAKAEEFADVVKSGRTHLMDAVPVTLGQEFGGYAAQMREGRARVDVDARAPGQDPARRHGGRQRPEHAPGVRRSVSAACSARRPACGIHPPADPFEAQANRDGLVEASGALRSVAVSLTKIANDLRWMGSGPRAGLAEIVLPELQKGSSIMPGKVNPVIPEVACQVAAQVIGNDAAIAVGGLQGNFELNVQIPLMARNLLQSIGLLAAACRLLAERCVQGIEANEANCERHAESTLAVATALNPYIGYDRATAIVKDAAGSGRSLREVARAHGVDEDVLDKALDLRAIARGNQAEGRRAWTSLVLQHIACEPPGEYETVLRELGANLHRVELDEGDPLPALGEFDAIVAMGGPMSVNDDADLPWLTAEKRLIGEAVRAGVPYFGACLGVQLLAASLGARVYPGPEPEVGVLPVTLTAEGAGRPDLRRPAADLPDAAVARRHVRPARRGDAAGVVAGLPEPGVPVRPARLRRPVPRRGAAGDGARVGAGARVRRLRRPGARRRRDGAAARGSSTPPRPACGRPGAACSRAGRSLPSPSPDSRFLALRFAAQDATDFGMSDDQVRRLHGAARRRRRRGRDRRAAGRRRPTWRRRS